MLPLVIGKNCFKPQDFPKLMHAPYFIVRIQYKLYLYIISACVINSSSAIEYMQWVGEWVPGIGIIYGLKTIAILRTGPRYSFLILL